MAFPVSVAVVGATLAMTATPMAAQTKSSASGGLSLSTSKTVAAPTGGLSLNTTKSTVTTIGTPSTTTAPTKTGEVPTEAPTLENWAARLSKQWDQVRTLSKTGVVANSAVLNTSATLDHVNAMSKTYTGRTNVAQFENAVGGLLKADPRKKFGDFESRAAETQRVREADKVTPISVAAIRYEYINPAAEKSGAVTVGKDGVKLTDRSQLLEGVVVAAAPIRSSIACDNPRLVIPTRMLIGDVGVYPGAVAVTDGSGKTQTVRMDQPFTVSVPKDGKPTTIRFAFQTPLGPITTTADLETDACFDASGPIPVGPLGPLGPSTPVSGPTSSLNLPFCDVPSQTSTSTIPGWIVTTFDPASGQTSTSVTPSTSVVSTNLNIRAYVGNPESSYTGTSAADCSVRLRRVIILVDGIDISGNRTIASIERDFGDVIAGLRGLGFDIIALDYGDGRAAIESNASYIQTFLTTRLPLLLLPGHAADDVGIIAGSMGTQTTRMALVKAERAGQDHKTDIFVSFDGPYLGANIPVGFQTLLQAMAPFNANAEAKAIALQSDAARQLLLAGPLGFLDSKRVAYATTAASLGMPTRTRNIAISNGSSTGTLQTGATTPQQKTLLHVDLGNTIWWDADFVVRSDDPTSPQLEGTGTLFGLPLADIGFTLSNPKRLDLAPGGFRSTTNDVIEGLSVAGLPGLETDFQINNHEFVPTFSAIGSSFSAVYTEKCNTEHVSANSGNQEFMLGELLAWANHVTPPPAVTYQNPCGTSEPPGSECVRKAVWFANETQTELVAPTLTTVGGAPRCMVRPTPLGSASVSNQSLLLFNKANCPSQTAWDGLDKSRGCVLGTVAADTWPLIGSKQITTIGTGDVLVVLSPKVATNLGGLRCPSNTNPFTPPSGMGGNALFCKISITGVSPNQFHFGGIDGWDVVMNPPAQACPIGRMVQGPMCLLGYIPVGTTGGITGGSYFYNP